MSINNDKGSVAQAMLRLIDRITGDADNGKCKEYFEFLDSELKFLEDNDSIEGQWDDIKLALWLLMTFSKNSTFNLQKGTQILCDIFNRKPLWPLIFKQHEFILESGGVRQNLRNPDVYEVGGVEDDEEIRFESTSALMCRPEAHIDICFNEWKYAKNEKPEDVCSRSIFLYDPYDNVWKVTSSTQVIKTDSGFTNQKFTIPVVEIFDSSYKKDECFCYISDIDKIPTEFYKYFTLSFVKPDSVAENVISKLEENNAQDYLDGKIKEPVKEDVKNLFEKIIVDKKNDVILVYCKNAKGVSYLTEYFADSLMKVDSIVLSNNILELEYFKNLSAFLFNFAEENDLEFKILT